MNWGKMAVLVNLVAIVGALREAAVRRIGMRGSPAWLLQGRPDDRDLMLANVCLVASDVVFLRVIRNTGGQHESDNQRAGDDTC